MTADEADEPIDAVIAWVDGSDPHHAARRIAALEAVGAAATARNGIDATRFSNLGEIYYCIASILKYAPFVRRIHVVCDQQQPEFLGAFADEGICAPDRIVTVDHRVIFRGYESALPTFNSLTIETMLWRVPGLAEHFLYFNDDFFVNAPLSRSDLLTDNGQLIIYGQKRHVWPQTLKHRLHTLRYRLIGGRAPRAGFSRAQANAARLLGQRQYILFDHSAHFLRRSPLEKYFAANPDILAAQISHRFRSHTQFVPVALAYQLALKAGLAVNEPAPPGANVRHNRRPNEALEMITDESVPFGSVQSLDQFTPTARARFREVMAAKLDGYLPQAVLDAFKNETASFPQP